MKVTKNATAKGFNNKNRKENHFYKELMAISPKMKQVICCRFYGTSAMSYCCIWVYGKGSYNSGSGSAGGYGYHRASAAAEEAIKAAGYNLSEPISGRGDSAIETALHAIAKAEGFKTVHIFSAHA